MDNRQTSLLHAFDDAEWPDPQRFPLNEVRRKVEKTARTLTDSGEPAIVITGFTSLDYLVEAFGDGRARNVDIVFGNEPAASSGRDFRDIPLKDAIRDYWLERGLSITSGSAVISLLEAVRHGDVRTHILERLHAKLIVGESGSIMGSSNFSYGGLRHQREANVQFASGTADHDGAQRIAENYRRLSNCFDDELCQLLEDLLKPCHWTEALARATAELLEAPWLRDYAQMLDGFHKTSLWPSQRQAIAQALYILDSHGSVLIADPTGSGKTRLGLHLVLALINRLYRTGRGHRTNALVVCPPLVRGDWKTEAYGIGSFAVRTMSHGMLSARGQSRKETEEMLRLANILVLDEAHNYLNRLSSRSRSVASTYTDHVILLTATPINRGPQDLLRLVEILGIDNLSDSQFRMYKRLKGVRRSVSKGDQDVLRDYIRQFTVRRTKSDLNKLVDANPDAYRDHNDRPCRYPQHNARTYYTGETDADKIIAEQINELCNRLRGLIYLRKIRKPEIGGGSPDAQSRHLKGILHAAAALSRYNIQATMRSSRAALFEHVHGTEQAVKAFGLRQKFKSETGDIIGTLYSMTFDELQFELDIEPPPFIADAASFEEAVRTEVETYRLIAQLGMRLSGARDEARLDLLEDLLEKHSLVLAFDSRVITIEQLSQLSRKRRRFEAIAVHGATSRAKERLRDLMGHGSRKDGWVALCSDAMSEGVNLQGASAVVLLDMPGVIRLAEQRIGRIDRMNSEHDEIEVLWPNDSEPFQLTTSRKFVTRYNATRRVIGVNMPLPDELMHEREERFTVTKIIDLYEDAQREIEESGFLQDAFQPVRQIRDDFVSRDKYELFKSSKATVMSRVSFVAADAPWGFFALRGDSVRAPQWVLVREDRVERDLDSICSALRAHLADCESRPWHAEGLDAMLQVLLKSEPTLIPRRRYHALKLLARSLESWQRGSQSECASSRKLRDWLAPYRVNGGVRRRIDQPTPDYYDLASHFLDLLGPYYEHAMERRRRGVTRLADLRVALEETPLSVEVMKALVNQTRELPPLDRRIAACIVGIPE